MRNSGNALDVALYREQLNRVDVLMQQEEEPVRSKDCAVLSLFQAEFALYLADNIEAVTLARGAVTQSEHVESTDFKRIARWPWEWPLRGASS